MTSAMRTTMEGQPAELRRLNSDRAPAERAAERLAGRRTFVVGTGTSWHAAHQGAYFLRAAGLDAWALASVDFALDQPSLRSDDALVALTHTGAKRYTNRALEQARSAGTPTVVISARGVGGADLETVNPEQSSAYTASHLGALFRLAQLARALGAELADLEHVPDAVEAELRREPRTPAPPERLLEYIGGGVNQWTAAEGALKVREAAYLASEGLAVEQFLHGPSVALRSVDMLVCLDGGGPWSERLAEVATAADRSGVPVEWHRAVELGELLSVFPLTVAVQRIALETAELLGVNPDTFGRDVPGREPWSAVAL